MSDEKPGCDGDHDEPAPAVVSMVMLDSDSPDALSFACADCAYSEITAWLYAREEGGDTSAWEIRRV
jgi:hypothetical protein